MQYGEALSYLDEHASYEKTGRVESPSLDNINTFMDLMGQPNLSYPVIHITGTNGKGSTTQIITQLLIAHGLQVGTYTSPHLETLTERISRNNEPISEQDFADCVAAIADIEVIGGVRPSYFEVMTAAAFRYFADTAVDVAVIEVGMLGRWDATNVVNSAVAVITNIALDHTEFAGPRLEDIAFEKVGISKPGSVLVVGDTNEELREIWNAAESAAVLLRGNDFEISENELAVGGRMIDVRRERAHGGEPCRALAALATVGSAAGAAEALSEEEGAPVLCEQHVEPDVKLAAVVEQGALNVLLEHPGERLLLCLSLLQALQSCLCLLCLLRLLRLLSRCRTPFLLSQRQRLRRPPMGCRRWQRRSRRRWRCWRCWRQYCCGGGCDARFRVSDSRVDESRKERLLLCSRPLGG
jgi:folylpolyglutamate synthase/dihydropteroate synthase